MPMLEFLRFKLISSSPYLLCHPLSFRSDFFSSHFLFLFSFFFSLSPARAFCKEIFKVETEDVLPKDEKTRKYQIILIDFNKNRGNEKHFHRSAGFHIFLESNEEEDKGKKKVFILFRFFSRCFHDLLLT